MRIMISTSVLVFSMSLGSSFVYAAIPHVFEPNTPAKAADVNENFDYLMEKVDTLSQKSIALNQVNGERSVDVDCTNDPAALSKAYVDNIDYDELNFTLTGSCYGDITVKREFNEQNQWTGAFYQVMGQTLNISSKEGTRAKLIANDLSGSVAMWGTFGNGLYLQDLDIEPAIGDAFSVAYSRNGHGSVVNVNISNSTSYSSGVYVQEGAQVYIQNSQISKANTAVLGRNNATIRVIGTLSADGADGIVLEGNSVLKNDGAISISATTDAIKLQDSTWWGWGWEPTSIIAGNIIIRPGSTMTTGAMNVADNSAFTVEGATVNIDQLMANNLRVVKSNMHISNSNIKGLTEVTDSSILQNWQSTHNQVNVLSNSSFTGWHNTVNRLDSTWASYINLYYSSVTEQINVNNANVVVLDNTSFSGDNMWFGNTKVFIIGATLPSVDKLTCSGMSIVEYGDQSLDLLTDAPNSGCFDTKAIGTLYEMIKAQKSASL